MSDGGRAVAAVRLRHMGEAAKWPATQILLKAQIPVDGDKDVEVTGNLVEERTIVDVGVPEKCAGGTDFVSVYELRQSFGHTGVQDHSHRPVVRLYSGLPLAVMPDALARAQRSRVRA